MASLQIGRILDWNALGNIERIPLTFDQLTINGRLSIGPDQIDKANAVRDQIIGLKGSDEDHVPFRIKEDPTLDRMVHVVSSSCHLESGGMEIGHYPWEITVENVPGGSLPNMESPLLGGLRSNGVGIAYTDVTPWHAIPAAALDYYDGAGAFVPTPTVIPTETGDINYYQFISGVGRKTARAAIPVGNWYDGAARIEQTYPDGEYYTPTSRHLRSGLGATGWRIGNGLIRFAPAADGRITLQFFEDDAWGDLHTFEFTADDGATQYIVDRINTIAVIRNTPEECRIRLSLGLHSTGVDYQHRTMLEIRVRRGARVGEFHWHNYGTAMLGQAGLDPAEAGTALGGFAAGGVTNTGDTQGNTAILLTPVANTFSTTDSYILASTPSTSWSFGLGIIKNGGFAAAPYTASDLRKEYFAPYGERMTVVGW